MHLRIPTQSADCPLQWVQVWVLGFSVETLWSFFVFVGIVDKKTGDDGIRVWSLEIENCWLPGLVGLYVDVLCIVYWGILIHRTAFVGIL